MSNDQQRSAQGGPNNQQQGRGPQTPAPDPVIESLRRENLRLAARVEELEGQLKLRRELDDKAKAERDQTPYALTRILAGKDGEFQPGDPIPESYCRELTENEDYVRGPVGAARSLAKRGHAIVQAIAPAPAGAD